MSVFHDLTWAEIYRVCGVLGFISYVCAYTSLSLRWLTGESITYFALNTIAATLVLVSLMAEFNLASLLIQLFWITIGLSAIALRLYGRAHPKRAVLG